MDSKFEMNLLNSEELSHFVGGAVVEGAACTKTGDTIYKKCVKLVGDITIKLCQNYELGCESGFAFCATGSDTSTCGSGFYLKPL